MDYLYHFKPGNLFPGDFSKVGLPKRREYRSNMNSSTDGFYRAHARTDWIT